MTAITADNLGRAAIRLPAAIFWPALFLAAAWAAKTFSPTIPDVIESLLPYLPYALALAGAIIGWRFNRSRLVFSLAIIVVGHWLLLGPGRNISTGSPGEFGYRAYALLFPIALVVLSMLRERGLLSRHGVLRALALTAAAAVVGIVAAAHLWLVPDIANSLRDVAIHIISIQILPDQWYPRTLLQEPAVIAFAAATVFFVFRLVALGNPPLESGALGALVAVGMALHFAGDSLATSVFFTTAATTLLVAVIQDSYRLAFMDELTGLPGRRALTNETMKLGHRYAIGMLDVDHFKKFNDTYGHDIGDQVLRMVASRMERVSGGGKPFRYGGEEFTVVFAGKTCDEALEHLDLLRQSIADSGFTIRSKDRPKNKPAKKQANGKKTNGKKTNGTKANGTKASGKRVSVTISIGVAERSDKDTTPESVTKAADQALYRAKKAGRNKVSK